MRHVHHRSEDRPLSPPGELPLSREQPQSHIQDDAVWRKVQQNVMMTLLQKSVSGKV